LKGATAPHWGENHSFPLTYQDNTNKTRKVMNDRKIMGTSKNPFIKPYKTKLWSGACAFPAMLMKKHPVEGAMPTYTSGNLND